eukprot:3351246-Pyramimonas_sp.AAC.1
MGGAEALTQRRTRPSQGAAFTSASEDVARGPKMAPKGSQRAPERPPRGPQEAPRGHQEAPKRPP